MTTRVHLIAGGFPKGSPAGHDMDYARLRLLGLLSEHDDVITTVASDFTEIGAWLENTNLLITYVAGPFPNDEQNAAIVRWLEDGGRWFGLHGTSGGKAARVEGKSGRAMVKTSHHATLGGFFLNHPPLSRFTVTVANTDHPLTRNLPASFEVADELYLIEMQGDNNVLLTTELEKDPSPPGFGFIYEKDTALQADGKTRVLGYTRDVGKGGVAYIALGHCHSPRSNSQPFVDRTVTRDGETPLTFRGSWETEPFEQLLKNGIEWGISQRA
ncbi:MAG: ThuA domain-containing protein [Gammaproteobacteria bacterium]|nr:ThuA domain-containing protein [Gammaproteobacteria bacterium]